MLWDGAMCSVKRTAAMSVYCDERGPKLNCRGVQGSLLTVVEQHMHCTR